MIQNLLTNVKRDVKLDVRNREYSTREQNQFCKLHLDNGLQMDQRLEKDFIKIQTRRFANPRCWSDFDLYRRTAAAIG